MAVKTHFPAPILFFQTHKIQAHLLSDGYYNPCNHDPDTLSDKQTSGGGMANAHRGAMLLCEQMEKHFVMKHNAVSCLYGPNLAPHRTCINISYTLGAEL